MEEEKIKERIGNSNVGVNLTEQQPRVLQSLSGEHSMLSLVHEQLCSGALSGKQELVKSGCLK